MTGTRRRRLALLAALSLAVAACGSRESEEQGTRQPDAPQAAAPTGDGVTEAATTPATPGDALGAVGPSPAPNSAGGSSSTPGQLAPPSARSASAAAKPESPAPSQGDATVAPSPARGGGTSGPPATSVPQSGSAVAPGPLPAPAKSEVVIGSVGTFSGPLGELLRAMADSVSVWVKWINSKGGVNGHLVRHVVADDGGDPARHRSVVRELVERHKIHAFVSKDEALAAFATPDPYVVEHRIPVVGTDLAFDYDYDSPFYFPQASSGDEYAGTWVGAWAEVALPKGFKRLGTLYCVESSGCDNGQKQIGKQAKDFGFEMVYEAKASFGQPDYTAECLAARNAGVQTFAIGLDDKSVSRLALSCARQGYRPLFAITATGAQPGNAADPNLNGTAIGAATFAWPARDNPARQEFHEAFSRFFGGRPISGNHAVGWVSGKLFEAATRTLPEPPTREAILQALWKMRNDDLGGLTHPLSFFPDRGAERHKCWSVVVIADRRFTAPNGGTVKCRR